MERKGLLYTVLKKITDGAFAPDGEKSGIKTGTAIKNIQRKKTCIPEEEKKNYIHSSRGKRRGAPLKRKGSKGERNKGKSPLTPPV